MFRSPVLVVCLLLVAGKSERVKRERITDHGVDLLICRQEPIEFAIGIDSSNSISEDDFQLAKDFTRNLIGRYDIGDDEETSRAAVFTYGTEVDTKDAFGLNDYLEAHDLWEAIRKIKHFNSTHTDTSKAIDYIHDTVLSKDKVRPNSEKVGIIITDGASRNHTLTEKASEAARKDGIIMLAIGVGDETTVSGEELLAIAGNSSRVLRVQDYSSLVSIQNLVRLLYHEHCYTHPKPTLPPCGQVNPTDLFFAFSPADLHYNLTWPNRFMTYVLESVELSVGFKVGVMDCPLGVGTNGNLTSVPILAEAIKNYGNDSENHVIPCPVDGGENGTGVNNGTDNNDRFQLPGVLQRLVDVHFSIYTHHRRPVVVIFSDYRDHLKDFIETQVETLSRKGAVEVFVALTSDSTADVASYYDFKLKGRTPEEQAEHLLADLCPEGFTIGDP